MKLSISLMFLAAVATATAKMVSSDLLSEPILHLRRYHEKAIQCKTILSRPTLVLERELMVHLKVSRKASTLLLNKPSWI